MIKCKVTKKIMQESGTIMGLSIIQIVTLIIGCIVTIGSLLLLWLVLKVGIDAVMWIVFLELVLFIGFGVVRIQGMSVLKFIKELTLKRSTSIIKGFTSQSGKTFDAKLTIKADNTIGFEFPERLKCPVCGKEMIKSSKGWVCTGYKNGCNFFIAGTICGKCITDTIATMLCANKRTRIINGFTSKSGKAFSAALIVKDGKIDFDFPAQSQKRSK